MALFRNAVNLRKHDAAQELLSHVRSLAERDVAWNPRGVPRLGETLSPGPLGPRALALFSENSRSLPCSCGSHAAQPVRSRAGPRGNRGAKFVSSYFPGL